VSHSRYLSPRHLDSGIPRPRFDTGTVLRGAHGNCTDSGGCLSTKTVRSELSVSQGKTVPLAAKEAGVTDQTVIVNYTVSANAKQFIGDDQAGDRVGEGLAEG
jgi:hypothetical protein